MLGGVRVPHTLGLAGHSDADVLTHAIIDGMLGAAGLGDIGQMFPSSELQWKDAPGGQLLRAAAKRVRDAGYRIVNIDATVIAQAPVLAPYIDQIVAALAEASGMPAGAISVKATTTDGLGLAGRGEGIAALAVLLLE